MAFNNISKMCAAYPNIIFLNEIYKYNYILPINYHKLKYDMVECVFW